MDKEAFLAEVKNIAKLGLKALPNPLQAANYIDHPPKSIDELGKDWIIDSEGDLEMYYSPFKWNPKENAKITLLGITPGWTQAEIAWREMISTVQENGNGKSIPSKAAFGGGMRNILIQQLNDINLHLSLGLSSCEELFTTKRELATKASVLFFPVFYKGKNYSGHSPKPLSSQIIQKWINLFIQDIIQGSPNALIIPMGISVENILKKLVDEKKLSERRCLWGFPHPSPANAHRYKLMDNNRKLLQQRCHDYFKD